MGSYSTCLRYPISLGNLVWKGSQILSALEVSYLTIFLFKMLYLINLIGPDGLVKGTSIVIYYKPPTITKFLKII